jgi:hypothetical protein
VSGCDYRSADAAAAETRMTQRERLKNDILIAARVSELRRLD